MERVKVGVTNLDAPRPTEMAIFAGFARVRHGEIPQAASLCGITRWSEMCGIEDEIKSQRGNPFEEDSTMTWLASAL